jgi:hypothetical protein
VVASTAVRGVSGLRPELAVLIDVAASRLTVSDLHVSYEQNREVVDRIRPDSDDDWLPVRRILEAGR